jgi:hypothetical protein
MILSWMNFSLPLVHFPNSTFLINVAQHSRPVGKYPGSGSEQTIRFSLGTARIALRTTPAHSRVRFH